MIKVGAKYQAPLHDSDLKVQTTADAPQAAYVNYQTLVALGEAPVQTDFSVDGARAIVKQIYGRPTARLLHKVAALTPHLRTTLTRAAEKNLAAQTGAPVQLDDGHPSAPLFVWSNRSIAPVTSDGYVVMALRSNRTHVAIGMIVPPGYGWASVGPGGKPRSPQEDAAREFLEEFGLRAARLEDLGINRKSSTLEAFSYASEDGKQTVPGVIPVVPYAAYTRLDKPLKDVLKDIRMNDENFGALAISVRDMEKLARGMPAVVQYHGSAASASVDLLDQASRRHAAGVGKHAPLQIGDLRSLAERPDAPKIRAKDKDGQPLRYGIEGRKVGLAIRSEDFVSDGRNFLAEIILAASKTGLALSPASQAYAREHANIEPLPSTSAAAGISPRPAQPPGRLGAPA